MTNERRSHQRYDRQEHILVDVVSEDVDMPPTQFDCSSRDFSFDGIRLHGHHPVALNSHVNLVVHLKAEQHDFSLSGVVRWVTETTENEHLAGVQLTANDSADLARWHQLFPTN